MGLLDIFNTPEGMQGLSLLAAAGPSMEPQNLASRLASAQNSYRGMQDNQLRSKMADMQVQTGLLALDKAKREAENEKGLASLMPQFFSAGSAGLGGTSAVNGALPPGLQIGAQAPVAARAPQFDVKGYTSTAVSRGLMNPLEAIKLQQQLAKETPINKLDVKDFTPASVQKFAQTGNYGDLVRLDKAHFADTGGAVSALDPFTGRPISSVAKTGDPYKDLILDDGQGGFRPNSPLIGAKQNIAKAGATNVKIENKMGEGIAAQVGPMLRDSFNAANGAAQQVDAANRIVAAIDTNKLFSGPGAGVRLKVAQVGQMLGVGGKDDAEKIANTRQAIRGLSEMTLQGRKQMTGQGAITESEGALAEKAQSGNIEDLTAAEIKQLAQASARAARFIYGQHEQMVSNVAADPNTANLAKFYKPLPMPNSPKVAPAAPQSAAPGPGVRFLGFE